MLSCVLVVDSTRAIGFLMTGVFLVAGGNKLRDPKGFASLISHLWSGASDASIQLAIVVGVAEVLLALWLASSIAQAGAWASVCLILAIFTSVEVFLVLARFGHPCNCFGATKGGKPIGWRQVCRNLGLLVMASFALVVSITDRCREPISASHLGFTVLFYSLLCIPVGATLLVYRMYLTTRTSGLFTQHRETRST
jgi:hypothetical protein